MLTGVVKQVAYVMEESLRVLTHQNVAAYCAMIDEIAAFRCQVVSTFLAHVTYTAPERKRGVVAAVAPIIPAAQAVCMHVCERERE